MTHHLAGKLGISRQAAHRHLRRLVAEGILVREGKGRGARYRSTAQGLVLRYRREGLEEDRVWEDLFRKAPTFQHAGNNAQRILQYALSELVNNAIEHSSAEFVEVAAPPSGERVVFEVLDDGVGIFDHIQRRLGLKNRLEALQELSKGKTTTDPAHHTGEGIFFVSKAGALFEIDSGEIRWIVDNVRGDAAIGTAPARKGTRVRFEIAPNEERTLSDLFSRYTHDFEFSKTAIAVKLFAVGVRFVSRSEGRRLVAGLERFQEVVLDFSGVEAIGQGFADEVFRVWSRAHPDVTLIPVGMSPPVEFMVERARRAR